MVCVQDDDGLVGIAEEDVHFSGTQVFKQVVHSGFARVHVSVTGFVELFGEGVMTVDHVDSATSVQVVHVLDGGDGVGWLHELHVRHSAVDGVGAGLHGVVITVGRHHSGTTVVVTVTVCSPRRAISDTDVSNLSSGKRQKSVLRTFVLGSF